jgi:hypothetical protein
MSPKHHYPPISGGDRKGPYERAFEGAGDDAHFCRALGPIDPSPTIDAAINGGYPWLQIECSRCKTPRDVDLAGLKRPATTFVHDLVGRLVCQKCRTAGKRPAATLLQFAQRSRAP